VKREKSFGNYIYFRVNSIFFVNNPYFCLQDCRHDPETKRTTVHLLSLNTSYLSPDDN